MRKDELVNALVRAARKSNGSNGSSQSGSSSVAKVVNRRSRKPTASRRPTAAQRRLKRVYEAQGRRKDLSTERPGVGGVAEDKLVLMVRDPHWLHATWEVSNQSIERAKAALGAAWHGAEPVLRLVELPASTRGELAEHVVRIIPINGAMQNWFIDVLEPSKRFRVDLGYEVGDRFHGLVRSNTVTTPTDDGNDGIDADVIEDSERIFAMSGGTGSQGGGSELREWFEDRLERPLGGPMASQFGQGAQAILERPGGMRFQVDAEMLVYGSASPDAFVTISGEPVALNEDGSFSVRVSLPERRQVLPMVATARNGSQEQTIILAIERNTKVLEPVVREPGT